MANSIQSIALDKLVAHPDNPNRMSKANFAKLLRNIKRTGRYEPLVVRPCPDVRGARDDEHLHRTPIGGASGIEHRDCFQIINGHHRCRALLQLGCKTADCVVWDIDDEQTDIFLATLNRLAGSDELGKKLKLLKRLNQRLDAGRLAKLLPQSKKQIERLTNLKIPFEPAKTAGSSFANPLVFFVDDKQKEVIEQALSRAEENRNEKTRAARRPAALTHIARCFLDDKEQDGQAG